MTLPIAGRREVRRAAGRDVRADRRAVLVVLGLNGLAAVAGLVGPWLLGRIVDAAQHGSQVDRLAVGILIAALARIVLARYAVYVGARFGERAAARIRERFLGRALALPAAAVEKLAVGDVVTRGTADVGAVVTTLRYALPEVLINGAQVVFVLVAVLVVSPLLGVCALVCMTGGAYAVRWYLQRASPAYLAEGAANSVLTEVLSSTAAGARTVEALGLQERRLAACEEAVAESRRARLATLRLRSVLFPTVDVSCTLPVVGVLLIGGALYFHGVLSLGDVVAAALYLRQLIAPLDVVLFWVEQVQSSTASYARVEGLASLGRPAPGGGAEPEDDRIEVADVRYAYDHGDVLHGVSLSVRPGERLAVVGPSGAGKSTLGRLLAGVDRPRTGSVTVGGAPIADLAPDRLRMQVALVTQEHHVFHDTLRDNLLVAAPDAELLAALRTVGADWAVDLDVLLGGDGLRLDGARSQQLALARVVLADPHTVILDEATALLDPATARHTERALAAVLAGRTVIAIAHRLQTAHDADRVAVMSHGRITELGPHDELVAAAGPYARLWHSWHGD